MFIETESYKGISKALLSEKKKKLINVFEILAGWQV